MTSKKSDDYRNTPFTSEIHSQEHFYTYVNVANLLAKCEENKDKVLKCRTIGILESINGCFFLKDMDSKSDAPKIEISMVYVNSSLPSTVMPYLAQLFGTIQWINKPVINAKIVQVLGTASGVRLNEVLKSVISKHLANPLVEC